MEIERGTVDEQLLGHAERQTKALETLQRFAFGWTVVLAVLGSIWLIVAING